MKKKLNSTVDVYGSLGKYYDYVIRVISSFAEIYNYEYTSSSIYEEKEGTIRTNGIVGRIRGFYENHLNEKEILTKMFYHEVTYDTFQKNEYGFLVFGNQELSSLAEVISLAVRMLEAFGMRDIIVQLDVKNLEKETFFNYLDVLDINYEEKSISSSISHDISFQIYGKNSNDKDILLIQGGDMSLFLKEFSGLSDPLYGFYGTIESLLEVVQETLSLEEKMLDVVITYESREEKEKALYLTQELRLNGFKTENIKRCEKSFIKKNYNTKYVISVKEKEAKQDEVVLTDLYTNEKKTVKELDLIQYLDMNF